MPMKGSGAAEPRIVDEWDAGFGWIAHPDETMQRASHALVSDDDVWVIDPVDFDGLDDRLAERGHVAGVAVLLDRHKRDAAAVARRHDASVYLPRFMRDVADEIDAPVEPLGHALPGTEYGVHKLVDNPVWSEAALYGEESGTLVVPESVGTAEYFTVGGDRLGVHPAMRFTPPRSLGQFSPERILVGHGESVLAEADRALRTALDGARREIPRLYAENVRQFLL